MKTNKSIISYLERIYFNFPLVNYLTNPIVHKNFNGLYIPKLIYLEVTNYCNAKCYMCPNEKIKRGRGVMPWDLFVKIIDECKRFEGLGLRFYMHKDGEPLLDPLLFKRINYIKTNLKKSKVGFNTNAALLNKENIDKILNSQLDFITFSIDGASRGTYNEIRIGLEYDDVKRNLDNFFESKSKLNKNIHTTMQMVVSNDNKHEIETYRNLWSNKADKILFKSMHNFLIQGTSIKTSELSKEQTTRCSQPFLFMLIYWNGDVGLCCWDYDNIANLGNVQKEPLLTVFNNDKFKEIRTAMKNKSCGNIKPCNICSQIYGFDKDMSYL